MQRLVCLCCTLVQSCRNCRALTPIILTVKTHLCLSSLKRVIDKGCRSRSDATNRGVRSRFIRFALRTGICIKYGNNKAFLDTPSTGNGQFKKIIGKFTRHKWVSLVRFINNKFTYLFIKGK